MTPLGYLLFLPYAALYLARRAGAWVKATIRKAAKR